MANVRRFFRYDVEIPVYFELTKSTGICLHASRDELVDHVEQLRLEAIKEELSILLDDEMTSDVKASNLFYNLNHRIHFIWWFLEKFMLLENPKEANDYKFRIREDRKLSVPGVRENSKIGHLIEGFNDRISLYLQELIESVQNSIDDKVFIFPRPVSSIFESTGYVTNLEQLAKQGVVPAKVLTLLIEKLNICEKVFTRLKIANRAISDHETWPLKKINLSAGGFSVEVQDNYDKFSYLNIFLKLGNDILISRGKLLFCKPISEDLNQVVIEFEFLSMENAEKITLYIQQQEIRDAMALEVI